MTLMKTGTSCLWTKLGGSVELTIPGLAMTHPPSLSQTLTHPLLALMCAWLTLRDSPQSLGEQRSYGKRRRCKGEWGAGPQPVPSQHPLRGVWIFGENAPPPLVKGL